MCAGRPAGDNQLCCRNAESRALGAQPAQCCPRFLNNFGQSRFGRQCVPNHCRIEAARQRSLRETSEGLLSVTLPVPAMDVSEQRRARFAATENVDLVAWPATISQVE